VETDLWQHYKQSYPGQVQLIGVDMYNGTDSQLRSYRSSTGATYPLLLLGASPTGGNLLDDYGPNDNYVVINKQGICRLNTYPMWAHGSRYRLSEIRACVDSLVSTPADVPNAGRASVHVLRSAPNPFRNVLAIEFSNPGTTPRAARVTVHDLAGRLLATLWEGMAPIGLSRVEWNGRARGGIVAGPGVYLVRSEVGGVVLTRRTVRIR